MAQSPDVHLDLLGGLAGDMFVAALVDLAPDLEPEIENVLRRCGRLLEGVSSRFEKHDDGVLVGRRFIVIGEDKRQRDANHSHAHADWRLIRSELEDSTSNQPSSGMRSASSVCWPRQRRAFTVALWRRCCFTKSAPGIPLPISSPSLTSLKR